VKRTLQRQGERPAETVPLWRSPIAAISLLAALTILVYVNSLPNGFVFDDIGMIVENTAIRDLRNIPAILGAHGRAAYRPLRTASHAVDYALFGMNPAGFRAVNIALHALNSSLVFLLFRTLLGGPRPALLAAILFAVHPIQTDSVTYISGRRDILFTTFYLAGFASFVRYRETDRPHYFFLAGLGYILSLLSKEMAISLPVLCICYDVVRSMPVAEGKSSLTRWQAIAEGVRTALRRNRVFYMVSAAVLLFLVWYFAFRGSRSMKLTMYGGGLGPTLMTTARIFVHYLKLLLFPVTLNADYSFDAFPVSRSLSDPRVLFALAILGTVGWVIIRLLSFARWAAFGLLWFFITLLPVSQIIPHHEMMAEHYLYLPSAGIFLTAAVLLESILIQPRFQAATVAGFSLVVALLGVRTVVRNRDWRDTETLWTKTIQTAPGSARAHTNVGEIALRKGRLQQAYREFQEAVRIQPEDAVNHDNLGEVLLRLGLFDEAEKHFRESLRIWPDFPKPHVNLGLVSLNQRRLDDAEREFRAALTSQQLTQSFRGAITNNLGIVLALTGRKQEAEQAFAEAVRFDPDNSDARANLGKAFVERGMTREGVAQLTEAIRLKPSDARLHYLLGQAYYQQGEKEFAALALTRALHLKADLPEARSLLEKIIRERASGPRKRG
jgi:Flp pilus assembly protein TadD